MGSDSGFHPALPERVPQLHPRLAGLQAKKCPAEDSSLEKALVAKDFPAATFRQREKKQAYARLNPGPQTQRLAAILAEKGNALPWPLALS